MLDSTSLLKFVSCIERIKRVCIHTGMYGLVNVDNRWDCCVICIEVCVCAARNEACGLVGAQPLGSKGPTLNFGASSVIVGSCFHLSEL